MRLRPGRRRQAAERRGGGGEAAGDRPRRSGSLGLAILRRLDHVAVVVRDTTAAVSRLGGWLGLEAVHSEVLAGPNVRLTYLDCGNCCLQLVEPLGEEGPVAEFLREHGEGLHHVCFGADDVEADATALAGPPAVRASGRGRPSAFVAEVRHGVTVELTEFRREEDVDASPGWLA